jgi:flagellar basal-body rod protein FlgB
MFNALFDSTPIPLLQKVASFTERRHEVLTGNIANVSTPDYQTRDLPVAAFQEALKEAAQRLHYAAGESDRPGDGLLDPRSTAALEDLFPSYLFQSVESAAPGSITFQDGNNRNIEAEVMEMTKNSLLQNTAIELMSVQMSRLQAVISERA